MSGLKGIMGRKLGMTQTFSSMGQAIVVTVLEAGPCTVLQKKTRQTDGYDALQLGFMKKSFGRLNKPEQGQVKKAGLEHGFYYISEFKVDNPDAFELGQIVTLQDLELQQIVDVTGVSKGRGFAGTVKKYGFSRGPMAHGSKHHREMGSVGQSAFPSRVIKGKRMPGRMGGQGATVKNSMVIDVRPEDNLLMVKGSVPGAINQLVCVKCK
ncbi:MAG: 50S ribosomal protein L3 [Desulfobacteraceae bacterium]|nr:50S ribosomal protein L3 [Desulfobacteraceae bacterium]